MLALPAGPWQQLVEGLTACVRLYRWDNNSSDIGHLWQSSALSYPPPCFGHLANIRFRLMAKGGCGGRDRFYNSGLFFHLSENITLSGVSLDPGFDPGFPSKSVLLFHCELKATMEIFFIVFLHDMT